MAGEPTIHDIARLAQVSIGTVSNVLNARPSVNEKLSKRVQDAVAALGYHRNSNAASLRSNQTDMIAVVVPNIENALFSEVVTSIEHRAIADRKGVMFLTTGEDQDRARRQIYSLVQRRVDGLIIIPPFDSQVLLTELAAFGIPVVLADRVEVKNSFPSVAVDNRQAGYIGGQHLFECGYREVALINHGRHSWILNERREGFAAAAREAGTLGTCRFHDFSLDSEDIRAAMVKVLGRPDRPRAIFAASNIGGKGAIPAIQQMGLRIPDDIALLIMDDFEALSLLDPRVSVVSQPAREIADVAWEMLQSLIAGEKLKIRHARLAPSLIVRGSTRAPLKAPPEGFHTTARKEAVG